MLGEYMIKIRHTCIICKSSNTYVDKTGSQHWYKHNMSWYCNNCNNRLFKNPHWHPITNGRYPKRGDKKKHTLQKKGEVSKNNGGI